MRIRREQQAKVVEDIKRRLDPRTARRSVSRHGASMNSLFLPASITPGIYLSTFESHSSCLSYLCLQ
jgi:hypothetical protein